MGLGKIMDFTLVFIVTITLVLNFSPYSQSFVNVTDILSSPNVPLHTFLSLLQTENVIEILQTQANAQTGLTLFAPNDTAFAIDNVPWGNLSLDQLQSLLLSHALPEYFGDRSSGISTLRQLSPVTTMAGGQYTLSFTSVLDTFCVNVSGSSRAQVLNAVNVSTYPTQVYQIDKVLMPEVIFGLSGGAIAGISIVVVMGALLVSVCIKWAFYKKNKVPGESSSQRDVELSRQTGRDGELQLPNQPQGASNGDKNANIGGGVSTGATTMEGGISLGSSKIGAPVSIGNTIIVLPKT
ncbi:hypothetical protein RHSIM_Rhsim05G0057600 [Rhododendron simsii]|uniref:FAS1 domain-containing protein n=1 Tax=Rhododendron simsii TaxID=118357 RepID=A0A834H0U8_RHOSS|nr:hypothetical protein RHSIM_Rhsim05G0057600 [Rhododendron simsii]